MADTLPDWHARARALDINAKAFIDGRYVAAASGATFDCVSPIDGRVLARVASTDQPDVECAVAAARRSFDAGTWARQPPRERKRVLLRFASLIERHAEELALLETLDVGKPISDSLAVDIPATVRCIAWYAEAVDKLYDEIAPTGPDALALITREPVGVVGAIVPWNFPLIMAAWKIGPALAAGNSFILKPSEKSPLTAIRIAALAAEAGIPDGVFNVLPGYGHTAGQSLALHMDVDCIGFTGSTRTGKKMLEYAGQSNMKRVWLECGGKSPNIILADCPDLERAAAAAAAAIFFNQGEMCSAGSRLIVEEPVRDAVLEKVVAAGRRMPPGDPLDPATQLGALVDEVQTKTVLGYIDSGRSEGARLLERRPPRARGDRRLLRRAHRVRRRAARDGHRARGDLRSRARCDHRAGRRGGRARRQPRCLRPRRRRLDARRDPRPPHRPRAARRRGLRQLLRCRRHHHAVRRLQAVRHRPRQVAARLRQVHGAQDHMGGPVVSGYRNVTFDELEVGASASARRPLTQTEIEALVLVSGDVEPFHIEDGGDTPAQLLSVDAVGVSAVISGLLERRLPGPGTRIVSTRLEYSGQVWVGEELAASVTVREKHPDTGHVVFDCDARVGERRVVSGSVVVEAPRARIAYSEIATPEIILRRNDVFARLLRQCEPLEPVSCAIAHPCDRDSLLGALEATRRRLIVPVLVGPPARIRAVADAHGVDLSGLRIVPTEHSHASAAVAVALARAGEVEMLMKGSLHTDEILGEVVSSLTGLRTERRLSHVFVMDVPAYDRVLLVTDAAINIQPTLAEKADIVRNAIDLAHVLGIVMPKVAILSAVETVNPNIASTLDAAALCKMADRGQIEGGILDGPLAFDNAISEHAARTKGIRSPVAGRADVLMVPNIESGNMLAKQLQYFAGADSAGVVLGARVPIVLTSRADNVRMRIGSAAVAKLLAHARRTVAPKAVA